MLNSHDYSVDFLNDKLAGPYVELNPVTGRPRLIKGLNEVWYAVERFGGIAFSVNYFGITKKCVHAWLDNHFIPTDYAYEIAKKLNCKPSDFQEPSLGYDDPVTGGSWPISWKLGWIKMHCD